VSGRTATPRPSSITPPNAPRRYGAIKASEPFGKYLVPPK
jgi:hypothetical protein